MKLELASAEFVESSCHRRLTFRSGDSAKPFNLSLYASPDLRFLSRELLDTTVDPVLEEQKHQQALLRGLNSGRFPTVGPSSAPVTITVFSDFQCPYCASMAQTLRKEVLGTESANVRLVFRHLPLPMHPWARPAAEAAECVQQQGGEHFWKLHDYIFEHQRDINSSNLRNILDKQISTFQRFDQARYQRCIAGRLTQARVDEDVEFASRNQILGTPTVFVNGRRMERTQPEYLRTIVREVTAKPSKVVATLSNDKRM